MELGIFSALRSHVLFFLRKCWFSRLAYCSMLNLLRDKFLLIWWRLALIFSCDSAFAEACIGLLRSLYHSYLSQCVFFFFFITCNPRRARRTLCVYAGSGDSDNHVYLAVWSGHAPFSIRFFINASSQQTTKALIRRYGRIGRSETSLIALDKRGIEINTFLIFP